MLLLLFQNNLGGCKHNYRKILAVTSQKDIEVFEFDVCFSNLLVGAGMGSFMTIERDETLEKFKHFVLKSLNISSNTERRQNLKSQICIRESRGKSQCGRKILNFDNLKEQISVRFKDYVVKIVLNSPNLSMREEIQSLADCSVLISQEGGAGALNMFLNSGSLLITIDYAYRGFSLTLDSAFYDRLNWIRHVRYSHKSEEEVVNVGDCQDFIIDVERMIEKIKL